MPTEDNEIKNDQTAEDAQMAEEPTKPRSFPWLMLCLAIFFDLIGLIPIVNIFSEVLASLIFGLWMTFYAPKTNPLIALFITKLLDAIFLGFLPSNIAFVIYAYIKQKAAAKIMAVAPIKI